MILSLPVRLPRLHPLFRLGGVGLLIGFFSGCATEHRSYYPDGSSVIQPDADHSAPVAVIEFDERGDFWDPSQVREADRIIRAKPSPILVTYVHGWRHDARESDGDLKAFRRFLHDLNEGLQQKVCGVYIGWRGASVQEEKAARWFSQPAALLSFWGRKKITDQMAGVPFTRTLWHLAASSRNRDGHSILIGHSFGGRIVEHTLGPTAIAQMNNSEPMPYNLTFLINPASESLYARQLKLALSNWKSTQPAVVALSARDDFATGKAWPPAMHKPSRIRDRDYVLNLPKPRDRESQKGYVTRTVGNDERQWTHVVTIGESSPRSAVENMTAQNMRSPTPDSFEIRLRGDMAGQTATCRLMPLCETNADHQIKSNAYWVIPLEKSILSGHGGIANEGGIFCPSMGDLMAGIIRKVGADRKDAPTVTASHPGDTQKSDAPPPSKFQFPLTLP